MTDQPNYENLTKQTLRSTFGTVQFPATKDEIAREAGDVTVPATKDGAEVPLKDVLDALPQRGFDRPDDVLTAVGAEWDRITERLSRNRE